jgi:hypothetical protein
MYRFIIATIVVLAPTGAVHAKDRTSAWREDLTVARDTFLQKDRSYTATTKQAAYDELERARLRVDDLTDQQIVASLARAAASSDNAHTRAYLLRNRSYWRRYPIRIWRFPDGWYVVAARAQGQSLVGGRLTHIQHSAVDQAYEKVRPLYAGNAGWANYMSTYTLTSPDALLAVGILDKNLAEFSVQIDGKSRSVQLSPEPLDPRTGPEESWWFLTPQHPAASGWTHVLASRDLPPALASAELNYSYARCDNEVLYVRYSRAADSPGQETVRAFGERLLRDVAARPPRKLVLDLRFNTGGNLELAEPLMKALAQSPLGSEPGRIAVLVSSSTFSAGITAAASLRSRSKAILVGAHPGDRPDFWSEGGNVILPNSGIAMHYADGLHQYSDIPPPAGVKEFLSLGIDVRNLEPDVAVDLTWREYLIGSDPVAAAAANGTLRCPAQ